MTGLSRRFGIVALTAAELVGGASGITLMPIYLYMDRRTFIHRLHPTVKILAIIGIFWSVYWVDNPLSLLPLGVVLADRGPVHARVAQFL